MKCDVLLGLLGVFIGAAIVTGVAALVSVSLGLLTPPAALTAATTSTLVTVAWETLQYARGKR